MAKGRVGALLFGTFVVCFLLLVGGGGVVMGVRCTINRTAYLNKGWGHSGRSRITGVRDRSRLYGPGVVLLGLSAIAAAIALPFVPLDTPRGYQGDRHRFPLFWRVIGYCMLAGFCCVMITVVLSVR
jgi:hypothetical protein